MRRSAEPGDGPDNDSADGADDGAVDGAANGLHEPAVERSAQRCPAPDCGGSIPDGRDRCPYCQRPIDTIEAVAREVDGEGDTGTSDAADAGPLPPALQQRFRIERPIESRSDEADLFLVTGRDGRDQWVLKVYHEGVRVDGDAIARIATADMAHVVEIEEHGVVDGYHFELLEHIRLGNLDRLRERRGGRLDAAGARLVLQELADAVSHLHGLGLKHGDLAPSNVLVRTEQPLDLVLGDFGLATVVESPLLFRGETRRSLRYAAPERLTGVEGLPPDVWALGVIVLECLLGRHPLDELADETIDYHLMYRSWPVSPDLVDNDGWRRLLRGMLHRDPEHRWTIDQVQRWLAGQDTADVADPAGVEAAMPAFDLEGERFTTREGVARALVRNWGPGTSRVESGHLRRWIERRGDDRELVVWLEALERSAWDRHGKLLRAALRLDPELPRVYRGYQVDMDGLRGLAGEAVGAGPEARSRVVLRSSIEQEVIAAIGDLTGSSDHRALATDLRTQFARLQELLAQLTAEGFGLQDAGSDPMGDDPQELVRLRILQVLVDDDDRERLVTAVTRRLPARTPSWFTALTGPDAPAADLVVAHVLRPAIEEHVEELRAQDRERRLGERGTAPTAEARLARSARAALAIGVAAAAALAPIAVLGLIGAYMVTARSVAGVWSWVNEIRGHGFGFGQILRLPARLVGGAMRALIRTAGDVLMLAALVGLAALLVALTATLLLQVPALTDPPLTFEALARRLSVPTFGGVVVVLLVRDHPPTSPLGAMGHVHRAVRGAPVPALLGLWAVALGLAVLAWSAGVEDPLAPYERVATEAVERVTALADDPGWFADDRSGPPRTTDDDDGDEAPAEPDPVTWRVVEVTELNVRAGPGTDEPIETTMRTGASLPGTGAEQIVGDILWVELELDDGGRGWASTRYLEPVD